ncbi:SlyX family protein [Steroidobacter sp.]|uniref:SlyX family protein n=1 Tax=Steroidobacter sp. TaxID=1978227 RepID=UPI001A53FAA7|nr:SlyX family protein [Steroidobacter sp.]MBL8268224.1 SlyX family protein [Steroidobacter sp.]
MSTELNTEFVESIELKIAYLERANNDLSEVVYRQQQQIDALRVELAALTGKMEAAISEQQTVYTPEQERPPHY